MENLLNIVESSEEIQIEKEKLKFITRKVNIWDHFGISKSQFVSLNSDEKFKMIKRFYKSLLPSYFGDGKRTFCCHDCVWFDDGKKQDCLKCGVNVIACTCYEFSDIKDLFTAKLNMVSVTNYFQDLIDKQEKEIYYQENGTKYSVGYNDMRRVGYQGQK